MVPMKKICVASGKGGVGKTMVSISLALALAKKGYRVAALDGDLTGANFNDIFGNRDLAVDYNKDVFIPTEARGIKYISLAQIVSKDDPVLWEGKDIFSAAKQLLERTEWEDIDFLIVDLPPGTESAPRALLPLMDYAVLVTIPSHLAESNVARFINMCRETQTPILGLVMNMNSFKCECGRTTRIFPEDHNFKKYGIPTLCEIPLDPKIAENKLINDFDVDIFLDAMKRPIILKRETMIGKGKKWILKKMLKLWGG